MNLLNSSRKTKGMDVRKDRYLQGGPIYQAKTESDRHMKFKYVEDKTDTRKPKAKLYRMNGSNDPEDLALWIKTNDPNKHIWLYTKGISVTVQSSGPSSGVPIKTFYEGDTLEITF